MARHRVIEIRAETALRTPEFWALHYYNIVGTEERDSGELIYDAFGLSGERLERYYFSLVRPEEQALLITVPTVADYNVGVQYVDCSEKGIETRYSLGHKDWAGREPIGHDSPHFALPAFCWAEVELISKAVESRSAEDAATVMLLLFPAVYLTTGNNPDAVEQALMRAWNRLRLPQKAIEEGTIRSAVEHQSGSGVTWSDEPALGWINDGDYSFRNPKTLMTSFEPRRFARIRAFLTAVELAEFP